MEEITKPFWEMKNVSKYFPGVKALNNITLQINKGEILGLLGENGCGKSTFIKTLSGVHKPEEGRLLKNGIDIVLNSPQDAKKAGVATVFQEFSLIPTLSVMENIYISQKPMKSNGTIDWKKMKRDTEVILDTLHINLNPESLISSLSVAEQQFVEIAKGYAEKGDLFILDEPTTALCLDDIERLHGLLKRLSKAGTTIIYISHRLDEVCQIVNRVAILRNGTLSGTALMKDLTIDRIVTLMSGRTIKEHYPKENNVQDDVIFTVDHLSSTNGVKDISFDIKKGEVFGLAGLLGSGRTEIARALFGVDEVTHGTITLQGKTITINSPKEAIDHGIAYVTENRKTDGLFFNFEGPRNTSIPKLKKLFKHPILKSLSLKKELDYFDDYIKLLEIEPQAKEKSVRLLSGGNQQKVVIARWLFSDASLFVFDEPTQGIDVGAKLAVYNVINHLTAQGKSVLLISSDHPELLSMSDRIGIIRQGRLVKITTPDQLDEVSIIEDSMAYKV